MRLSGAWQNAPMAPKPTPRTFKPAERDEADVRAGLDEAERGEGRVLTHDELARWAETGEWPESLD